MNWRRSCRDSPRKNAQIPSSEYTECNQCIRYQNCGMQKALQPRSSGPLAGLVVIDLTRVLAGPYCTLLLADLGARVIKVELPQTGDDARHIGPFIPGYDAPPTSGYFFSVNRNKESIALDLKVEADRSVFERLLASADV